MKRLVVAGGSSEEGVEVCPGASTSDNEFNIVTVSSDNIVTLATSVVAQLTGQASAVRLRLKKCQCSQHGPVTNGTDKQHKILF